ncbi:UNVERIFIED_CONTAM: hypothetical protein PYX00_005660 [Menopon gallinae]|uniref:Thyroid transcription factor 1-associated protein 26 n=1 Tax=Menopon gallinae TaxID=328185 RepID=A0AAW2HT29_9NEOP
MQNTDSAEGVSNVANRTDGKKPFNKKKWREQKYSIKAKVKRWEEKRRKNMTMKYHRELKKSGINLENLKRDNKMEKGMSPMKKAQLKYQAIQEAKQKKREEMERVKSEREQAIKAYKEKKAAKFRKLSQKTSKGQPVMRGRMELLLEKIEKNYANHNS